MKIIVITHAAQGLMYRQNNTIRHIYMIGPVLDELKRLGHDVLIYRGLVDRPIDADMAIMHVDLTIVPSEYIEYGAAFPICINLQANDISKSNISGAILDMSEDWSGPVIVKSNLNCNGLKEAKLSKNESSAAEDKKPFGYRIYNSINQVPKNNFDNNELVVEKFLPERNGKDYACRFWSFAGDQERCTRIFSSNPIVKSSNMSGFEFCDVPEEMRALRRKLGFDYGKFDFVIHEGRAILLDANKTPGAPPITHATRWPIDFANGLLSCIK